jgi:hypothetical protein
MSASQNRMDTKASWSHTLHRGRFPFLLLVADAVDIAEYQEEQKKRASRVTRPFLC